MNAGSCAIAEEASVPPKGSWEGGPAIIFEGTCMDRRTREPVEMFTLRTKFHDRFGRPHTIQTAQGRFQIRLQDEDLEGLVYVHPRADGTLGATTPDETVQLLIHAIGYHDEVVSILKIDVKMKEPNLLRIELEPETTHNGGG